MITKPFYSGEKSYVRRLEKAYSALGIAADLNESIVPFIAEGLVF